MSTSATASPTCSPRPRTCSTPTASRWASPTAKAPPISRRCASGTGRWSIARPSAISPIGWRGSERALNSSRHCERSEAIQNPSTEAVWIASSQELLAMTVREWRAISPSSSWRKPGPITPGRNYCDGSHHLHWPSNCQPSPNCARWLWVLAFARTTAEDAAPPSPHVATSPSPSSPACAAAAPNTSRGGSAAGGP